jgi:hypothetical protein
MDKGGRFHRKIIAEARAMSFVLKNESALIAPSVGNVAKETHRAESCCGATATFAEMSGFLPAV